jgi:hypothetical protein
MGLVWLNKFTNELENQLANRLPEIRARTQKTINRNRLRNKRWIDRGLDKLNGMTLFWGIQSRFSLLRNAF